MKHRKKRFLVIILIFVVCMGTSTFLSFRNIKGILDDSYENDNRIVASVICNGIENSFLRPIMVAETMSKDSILKEIVKNDTQKKALEVEEYASEYLESIRDGFGYSIVFAVSDLSKAYFTSNGISKFVNPGEDHHDEWYKLFLESGKVYDLDVDTDEAANWSLSVFVNSEVRDEENNLIGVCGVGVDMTELQRLLEKYERIYNVKVDIIDNTGLIQVDTQAERIERDYIKINNLEDYSDGELYYEVSDDKNIVITYMEDLDWYLVVQYDKNINTNVINVIRPGVICLALGIIVFVLYSIYEYKIYPNEENKINEDNKK